MIKPARRLEKIPPYIFARIDRLIEIKRQQGRDIINLGVGDPDLPTPQPIIDELCRAVGDPENHRYPSYFGMKGFRDCIAKFMDKRFGVNIDPDKNILPVIGSKDGIAHLSWAFVNEGDLAIVPDPGYIVYGTSTLFCGGIPVYVPLLEENGYLLDLDSINEADARASKLMFINYPNNPTAAVADLDYYRKVVEFAYDNDLIICHDAAYSEITYDGYVAPSILEVDGAKDRSIEFHSLSKSFNMTGWRIGFAVGGDEIINHFSTLKTNIDSGIFNAIQYAAIKALNDMNYETADNCKVYERRRDRVLKALIELGISAEKPLATMYIWAKTPTGYTSESFCEKCVSEADVVLTPGSAFGKYGEGYIRISLTIDDVHLDEALYRLSKLKI